MANKSSNKNLHRAHGAKKDEFYTQLVDIENELKHYKNQFKGKIVYCNCDDPFESNFFKYFASAFNDLKLKKLIATSFVPSPIAGKQLSFFETAGLKGKNRKQPFKIEISEVKDMNFDGAVDIDDVKLLLKQNAKTCTLLKDNGDFRSLECIELLKQADIVVTNPPFSLFREYVAQLVEHNKKFLILGDQNAVTYKETFKLIEGNKLWLGYDNNGTKWFQVPDDYDIPTESRKKIVNGVKYFSFGRIMWYTNLDTTKRHQDIDLYKEYKGHEDEYPKYDNYDVIEVSKVSDIPKDYKGVMGVPITFFDKYNPKQFEILGVANSARWIGYKCLTIIDGRRIYNRILIKNKKVK